MIRLLGNHDGSGAVDYTVNCASGFPPATGSTSEPVQQTSYPLGMLPPVCISQLDC